MLEVMVVYIFNPEGKVLLFEKLIKYCAGHLVGPGGKVEQGETLHDASVRETLGECGLTVVLGEPLGSIKCHNKADLSDVILYVYRTEVYSGEVRNTEPLKHARMGWYPVSAETIAEMMEGDRTWFQHIVHGTKFEAEVWYDTNWHLIDYRVQAA